MPTTEDAMARLVVQPDYDDGDGPKPCVHTFVNASGMLLGAHWPLALVREAIEAHGVEEAGGMAAAMGHALVILRPDAPVFLEARVAADPIEESGSPDDRDYPCPGCGTPVTADKDSDAYAQQWPCDDCSDNNPTR